MKNGRAGVERLSEMQAQERRPALPLSVALDDFRAYMPAHNYIYIPSGDRWPGASVNARIQPIRVGVDESGKPVVISAAAWLDRNRPVEQMTWSPGSPKLISGWLINQGGWMAREGVTLFNQYIPPAIPPGDPSEEASKPWLDHVRRVYPNDADRIIRWLAHRVQKPQDKINHALVLGGHQGIGKDTLLEPVKRAIGPWNFVEASPQQVLGRFNGFLKSVILRVSEARDLGEVNRNAFYEHMKAYTAAPPDVLRVDEKFLQEHYVPNCCGVIITTNYKTGGIFLPADDRRHDVAWSELTKEDFAPDYWARLWSWYDRGGDRNVAAYLAAYDLSRFDPKAPPFKTKGFWEIVDASRAAEDAELADVIDAMAKTVSKDDEDVPVPGSPIAFTLAAVLKKAEDLTPFAKMKDGVPIAGTFAHWLADRKNRRLVPHRFEGCRYAPVRNPAAGDGLWKIAGKRQTIYARADLPERDRIAAAQSVVELKGATVAEMAFGHAAKETGDG
jgi:hypothetical protein